jgi:hypothetical protein
VGPAGPAGAAGSGLTVVASNGNEIGHVISFVSPTSPIVVAMNDQGIWLQASLDTAGLVPSSYLALYLNTTCSGTAYTPLDTNPAPFFRMLQSLAPGSATAYYAGNPVSVQQFLSMSPVGQPDDCHPSAAGWEQPLLAGPLRTFDMTRFPAPYAVKP